jgi:putative Holliday junction resolvase
LASRLLGIDPGTKRCGIAVTDSALTMAFPRPALLNDDLLLDHVATLVDEESIGGVVIGRPISLAGNVTQSTAFADELFKSIRTRFDTIAVMQWDERLTTFEAQNSLSRAGLKARDHRERVDSAAAVIMLQNYVDALHFD